MKISVLGIVAAACLALPSGILCAQEYSHGKEVKTATINFAQLAAYYKLHPMPLVRKPSNDEDERESPHRRRGGDPSMVHMLDRSLRGAALVPHLALLPASSAVYDTFLSTSSPQTAIPPDTHGAVDSQYCVTAINTNVHIQTRTGGEVSNMELDGFWSSVLPASTGSFDPRVHYDPYNKRWILIADAVDQATFTNSNLLVAVSVTNDPTGDWHMYVIPVDPTGATWLDFPNVGFNNQWIVICGNIFEGRSRGSGASVFVVDYGSVMSGSGAPFTRIDQPSSFSICPAQTFDPLQSSMFTVESSSGTRGQLQLWKITGPVSTPVMTSLGFPATTQHWHGSAPGGSGDFGPQLGTPNLVACGDDRFTSLIYRNNMLWCSHTVFLPDPGSATHSSVMWWQIDTLANPIQVGLIDDPTGNVFHDYSSMAVNSSNDIMFGFGYLSSSIYPSCGYAMHMHTDPLDSVRPAVVYHHGLSSYYVSDGSTNRWGDYSQTVVDPRNDQDFWTIQESSNTAAPINWDTWWAHVELCPKPNAPTLSYSGAIPCIGDTVSYSVAAIPGATSYTWIVDGGGWTGSSTSTSIVLTAGTGATTVVVLAYNACGEGESNTFTVSPLLVPSAPFIEVYTPPCTGVGTAVFTASGGSNFLWHVVGTGWSGSSSASSLSATVGTGPAEIICNSSNRCGAGPNDTLLITPGTPVASFTESTHSTSTTGTDIVTFTGTAPAGSTYSWDFGGGVGTPGTGAGPQTVHWTTGGTKTITVTVNNYGCIATYSDTIQILDLTGVMQLNKSGVEVSIMPNPSDGSFNIVFDKNIDKPVTVKLIDVDGRTVYSKVFNGGAKLPVVANNVPAGSYLVSISVDADVVTQKITITR